MEKVRRPDTIKTASFSSYEAVNELAYTAVLAEISKLEKGTAPALEYLAEQLQTGKVSIATRVIPDQPLNHMCLPYQDYLTQGDWIKDLLRYVKQAERTMDGADKQASGDR
ncbi:MAG: hypothetical protein JKY66_00105 [Spongiibacteraceae bacterium]|nr:hypothetical protein [Spongiibacteraceae bacterium]